MIDTADLRRASRADAPAIAAVLNDWIDGTDWMPRIHPPEKIAHFVASAFDARVIWVIGDPVAAYLSVDPRSNQVVALYSRAPGQGHGKTLLDWAKKGRHYLWLTTYAPNTAAQRFYTREGFLPTGTVPPQPPEVVPSVRMEAHL